VSASSVYADIDLAALRHNLSVVRRHAPGCRIMAVVKSNAYGHGALELACALAPGVDALAVARTEEALALRAAGLHVPLVVLEGPVEDEDLRRSGQAQLQLTIHHESQLALLAGYRGTSIDCWLKCDTGMHRLGFAPDAVASAWSALMEMPSVRAVGLMTHLACADDPEDPMTARQVERMHAVSLGIGAQRSIANSAGILAWPETHADWIRPGLMLYGVSPLLRRNAADLELRAVMGLHARLIAINVIPAGDTVGYGATWTAPEQMPLGVVGIGYGDGYPRHIGPDASVLLRGKRVPVVGRVSMDMITVDLRGVAAEVGDKVMLWGDGLPVEEVAAWAGTIPYTLLCGVTERVERRYRD